MATLIGSALILAPLCFVVYAYIVYPVLLLLIARVRGRRPSEAGSGEWPMISISLPAYNEESQIRGALDALLAADYPSDRRQIIVVSDGSTDGTDAIVAEYRDRGVELLRQKERAGKGAAENAAGPHLLGDFVVNTDASIRIQKDSLKPLIAALADPEVGVASGRDVSVARTEVDANRGESRYVGYEMWIRGLETGVSGIVGASGCFYAIRRHLHCEPLPDHLSRDFASALIAREHGYRAVSVDEATCLVPRTASLRREYRRKVRTIARGMETLWEKRYLMNPLRYGAFAWMLLSHKICRWLVPWSALGAAIGLALVGLEHPLALFVLGATAVWVGLGALGFMLAERRELPRLLALPAYVLAGNMAAMQALVQAVRQERKAVWEPTRRDVISPA